MSDDMKFLNPYTFVPAFPRKGLPEPLGDGSPLGGEAGQVARGRLHPDRWTGRIGVRLIVETPLLLLDTARRTALSEGADAHRVYPVQVRGGRPHLAATSLKGMLRSAYEAVTNSRFGVFDGHDTRLGFRRGADYALGMVPVLVGSGGMVYGFEQAALEMYDRDSGESVYPRDGQEVPRHLERLQAVIRSKGGATSVVRFVRKGGPEKLVVADGERVVEGIAFITGPNIEKKTSERLFYLDGPEPRRIPPARAWSEIEKQWNDLIADYGKAHKPAELYDRERPDGSIAGPGERIGDGPGQLAWSPHLHDESRKDIKGGRLCYARLVCDDRAERRCAGRLECDGGNRDCADRLRKEGRVDRLYPVLIPRDLYPVSPAELLDESLSPAAHIGELSPADRVFGWVAPDGKGVRPSAYRGRLRVGPVTCEQDTDEAVERFGGDGLPLAILGRPKPQQGRFYLAESMEEPDRPIKDGTPKEKLYRPGHGLRGRKVYWHHAGLNRRDHWSEGQGTHDPTQVRINGYYREYRRPRAPYDDKGTPTPDGKRYRTKETEQQRDTQNRSIKGWVRPGTTFRFVVEVRDLDDHELGALAWLLTLPPGHFHRLGLGRPLGFGSVRLDIDEESTELHSGAEYADHYRSLSDTLPDTDGVKRLIGAGETFNRMVEGVDSLRKVCDAMLAVARGNPKLPVHYPRTRPDWAQEGVPAPPDPRGGNYAWFTENERSEGRRIAPDRGRSLPAPGEAATPLVVYPVKKEDEQPKKGNRTSKGASHYKWGEKGQKSGGRKRY
ncbi:TIGR03986 family CRISPR-associated RAMP protein [Streptosporangium sp. NPDC049078]|uniref:TIGR03986 family type III CRISPR-associated RAMP protein n=1 Tax=Streptosporangium sp. NPDC049078 TaxID=3155767 RepID=UPI003417398F